MASAPRRENLIYALLVAVVVRGIRAARVRAILRRHGILLMRVIVARVVVSLVRVVVRRVRAAGVRAICLRRMRVVVRLVACAQINQ